MMELSAPIPIFRTALLAAEAMTATLALPAVEAQQIIDVARYRRLHFEADIDFDGGPATLVQLEIAFSRDRATWHIRTVPSIGAGVVSHFQVVEEIAAEGAFAFSIDNDGAQFMRVRAKADSAGPAAALLLLHVVGQRPVQ